jgi:hypothetical protein
VASSLGWIICTSGARLGRIAGRNKCKTVQQILDHGPDKSTGQGRLHKAQLAGSAFDNDNRPEQRKDTVNQIGTERWWVTISRMESENNWIENENKCVLTGFAIEGQLHHSCLSFFVVDRKTD